MKKLYIFLLLLLILPGLLEAQYRYDGRRIWPATIDSTKFTSDRSAVLGPGIVGGAQLTDATLGELWIPVQWDSGATAVAPAVPGGPWSFGADNYPLCVLIGTEPAYKVFGFDADGGSSGDDTVFVSFPCPANYKDDTMEIFLYIFHMDDNGAITDSLVIGGSVAVFATASTDSTVDIWDTGTAMTAYADVIGISGPGSDTSADSMLHIINLDPEVVDIDPSDWIKVMIYFDESRCDLDSGEECYLYAIRVTWDVADVN